MSIKFKIFWIVFLVPSLFAFVMGQNVDPKSADIIIIEHSRQVIAVEKNKRIRLKIPLKNVEPFLAYSFAWSSVKTEYEPLSVYFTNRENQLLQDWQPVKKDIHNEPTDEKQVSELYFVNKNAVYIYLDVPNIDGYTYLKVHFYNPGKSRNVPPASSNQIGFRGCSCPQPEFLTRDQWCPGGCPQNYSPVITDVTHLIVHHSATANTASDWAAVVRSFWDYHVNTHGWDDIGYNWLIDPNGTLYIGRGDNVRGAHFSGHNTGTMGVCVIGTYTTATPTDTAMAKLKKLLAWKSCDKDIDPKGTSYHASSNLNLKNIAGHRDSGSGTECPGDVLYGKLPQLRLDVDAYTHVCEGDTIPQDTIPTPPVDTTGSKKIVIYPNPVTNDVHLYYQNNLKKFDLNIEIFDETGRLVVKKKVHKEHFLLVETIPFKSKASGLYFMRLTIGKNEDVIKFVKQ